MIAGIAPDLLLLVFATLLWIIAYAAVSRCNAIARMWHLSTLLTNRFPNLLILSLRRQATFWNNHPIHHVDSASQKEELHEQLLQELLQWHASHQHIGMIQRSELAELPSPHKTQQDRLNSILQSFKRKLVQSQHDFDASPLSHKQHGTYSYNPAIRHHIYNPHPTSTPNPSLLPKPKPKPEPEPEPAKPAKQLAPEPHLSARSPPPPLPPLLPPLLLPPQPPPPPPQPPTLPPLPPPPPPLPPPPPPKPHAKSLRSPNSPLRAQVSRSKSLQSLQPQSPQSSPPKSLSPQQFKRSHSTLTLSTSPPSQTEVKQSPQRTRQRPSSLQANKPYKLVGRKQLRQWRELQQLRKWHHLQQLHDPEEHTPLQPPSPTLPNDPSSQLNEVDQELYFQIKNFLHQPSSRVLQEKIWHQMHLLEKILMHPDLLEVKNLESSPGIPALSAAWFLSMVATLEKRLSQYSHDIDTGLEQIRKDAQDAQQLRREISAPVEANQELTEETIKMLRTVKELEIKYRVLDDKIKSGAYKVGEAENNSSNLSYEELLAQIREKQQIIFSETATKSEIEAANIQLERLMAEYEKCPEVIAAKEEKRALNEKLNNEALQKIKPLLDGMNAEEREQLVKEKKVFKLMFMSKDAILKMHQNDFAAFAFLRLTSDELRALRAWVPTFRREQASQVGWQEGLDARIEYIEKGDTSRVTSPRPVIKSPAVRRFILPPSSGESNSLFAELLAKAKKNDWYE